MTEARQIALKLDDAQVVTEEDLQPDIAAAPAPLAADEEIDPVASEGVGHPGDMLDELIATAPQGSERPATLVGCLANLASRQPRPKWLLRDASSAVSTLAKGWKGAAFEKHHIGELPADPVLLRPILAGVGWVAMGATRKTEANVRSSLTSLLLATGWVAPEFRPKARRTGGWLALIERAQLHKLGGPLGPFARFCALRGVDPFEVTNADLGAYLEARATRSFELQPRQTAIAVCTSWRRMQAKDPDWPQARLSLPSAVKWHACRIEDMPLSFQEELERYLQSRRAPDPLDEGAARAVRELTVQHGRRAILRACAYLVESGVAREAITSLSVLVEPVAFKALLLAAFKAAGDTWTYTSGAIAQELFVLASTWVRRSPEVLLELGRMRRRAKKERRGLSRAVRERLAQFEDPEMLKALFELPEQAFAEAERQLRNGRTKQAAKLHEVGLMLAVLLVQPIRRKDLSRIDLVENFVRNKIRNKKGALERIIIDIGVKNTVMIEIGLPLDLVERIERHIAVFRCHVDGHNLGTALFPGPSGRPLSPDSTGRRVTKLVVSQLGAHLTPHDARHLAATLLLDADPGNMVVVQRLLGHTTPKTTATIYGTSRTSAAQRAYAGIVEELRGTARRKDAARSRRSRRGNGNAA